ncbi:MAG TPA: nitroreductase/quinone reductase family protein [Micromonosporaceae bacterium]|jgi:deazaflavin-dependent oxidoreductase (nitroreductase family)
MPALGDLLRRLGHHRLFPTVLRPLVPVDRFVGRLTSGRVVALGIVPSLLLTTTGRRSGRPHTTPLTYAVDGDSFVVIGSNWGRPHQPAWALNLLADPHATVRVGGREVSVRARRVTSAERERLFTLLLRLWPAYATYVERAAGREIPVFVLERKPVP